MGKDTSLQTAQVDMAVMFDALRVFHAAYRAARIGCPRRSDATYAAVQAVLQFARRQQAVGVDEDTAREQFEKWVGITECTRDRLFGGMYVDDRVEAKWQGWKAALAQFAAAHSPEVAHG